MGSFNQIDMDNSMITDYSYSGLVDIIQGEEEVGGDVLLDLANQLVTVNNTIDKLERELKSLKITKSDILGASQRVLKHLSKDVPLAVIKGKTLVVVTQDNITIEKNVI